MSRNFELLKRAEKQASNAVLGQDGFGFAIGEATSSIPLQTVAPVIAGGTGNLFEREVSSLVQRLLTFVTGGRQMMLFADIERPNGSAGLCVRAGAALAGHVAGRVLVADANLAFPGVHHHLNISNDAGLADCLLGDDPLTDFVHDLNGSLFVLPAGHFPSAGLRPDRVRERLAEMRRQFDVVLIDAPPVSLGTDALALGQLTDGVVLVVQANSTRREPAIRAKQVLQQAHVPLLGAVLLDRELPIPESIYRHL